MNQEINYAEVKEFIDSCSPETRIYLGSDSERLKIGNTWYADYMVVIAVHIDGCHGCRLFGSVTREKDYDNKKDRPIQRLMNEVYKLQEVYTKLHELVPDRNIEVHLDLNPDKTHGSSCAVQQAVGYIRGTCNVTPLVKPLALAASFGADRFNRIADERRSQGGV